MAPVLDLLRDVAGLAFTEGRGEQIEAAVGRAMRAVGAVDIPSYVELLSSGGAVLDGLITECTVGETYFLREPEQLEYIRREVFAEIADRRPEGRVRIWSAGCASGEEAYSLAILLRGSDLRDRATVIGTDLARDRLARARAGWYGAWSLRDAPESVVGTCFTRRSKVYDIAPDLRSSVRFRHLNLISDDYPSSASGIWEVDLILCRNVLIYLDRETLPAVAGKLYAALAPGGWLFLAASDPPLSSLAPFETLITDRGIAYRRPVAPALGPTWRSRPHEVRHSIPRTAGSTASPRRVYDGQAPEVPVAAGGSSDARSDADRVRALADQGRLAEAGRACATALEKDGLSPELLYLHSVLLAQAGHYPEAAGAARHALYLREDLVVGHIALGTALERMSDGPGARRAFRTAVRRLSALPPSETVPASGGEVASRLLELARTKLRLLGEDG